MAKILHVDVESLIGQPWQLAPNGCAGKSDDQVGLTCYQGCR
jgi:hypothetical protein